MDKMEMKLQLVRELIKEMKDGAGGKLKPTSSSDEEKPDMKAHLERLAEHNVEDEELEELGLEDGDEDEDEEEDCEEPKTGASKRLNRLLGK